MPVTPAKACPHENGDRCPIQKGRVWVKEARSGGEEGRAINVRGGAKGTSLKLSID